MLASLVDVAGNVGLPVIFLLVAVESMGVPLPGETALFTGAIVASKGRLDIVAVIAVGAAAAIIGDNLGYTVGRWLGREVFLSDRGPLQTQRHKIVELGDPFFQKHGPKAVFFGRFVTGLRFTAAWMAGITRMHWLSFGVWNALGGILWAIAVGLLGYYAGHAAEDAFKTVGLFGVGAVVIVLAILWYLHRNPSKRPRRRQ